MNIQRFTILFFCFVFIKSTNAQVDANFTINQYTGCTLLNAEFTHTNLGSVTSWNWDLAGTPSSVQSPVNNYGPGIYPICLTVSDGTNSDTFCDTIKVYAVPAIAFDASPLSGCGSVDVQFTNQTITGTGIDSVLWTFGDGGTSTAVNPQHTYGMGLYSVSLWVQDNAGCFFSESVSDYINVSDGPTAEFSSSNAQNCAIPSMVNFQNTSTNAAGATYLWDFGVTPTATSTATNPSYNYTTAGSYDVTLITTTNGCSDTIIKPNFVTLQPQVVEFSTANTNVCIGESVSFIDNSTLIADNWDWNFGVGGVQSNAQNPSFVYNTAGTYTVSMVAYLSGCNDSITKNNYITVNENPIGSFISNGNQSCSTPFSVDFTSTTDPGSTYLWNFGESPSSTLPNPTHIYNSSGSFTVSLTVTNSNNCSSTIDSISMINIFPPNANFNLSDDAGCAPLTIDFTDISTSSNEIVSWMWDFDDGSTQNGPSNPSHEYTTPGVYSPTLEVTDSLGCTHTFTGQQILLGTQLIPNFSYTPDTACGNIPVTFQNITDTLNSDSIYWTWSFGDGGIHIGYEPPAGYIYSDTGYMNVSLQTISNGCQSDTTLDSIIYVLPPIAIFTESYDCINTENVLFEDESIGPDLWNWFIDGDTIISQDVNYTFPDTGNYLVMLQVENISSGCTDTISKNIIIVDPIVNFSYDDSIGCPGLTVNFTELTQDAIEWNWNFGEGVWYTGLNPSYTYNNTGVFDVTLAIRSLHDCYDTLNIPNAIRIFDVDANFSADSVSGCSPLNVNFIDSSTTDGGNIVSWLWDFGDGSPTTTIQNPSHTFTGIGNFSTSLTVTDSAGCTSTHIVTITASGIDVSFINDSVTCDYDSVSFQSTSTSFNNISSWNWDFGDNTTSILENPSHNYLVADTYVVELTVTDIFGCAGNLSKTIFIDSMYADFSASDSIINCAGASSSVSFFSNTPANTTIWNWNFPSSFENPTVNFSAVGLFDVSLTATNTNGCVATETKPNFITINGPYATLETSEDSICLGSEIIFSVNNTNSVFQKYVFGGGIGLNTTSYSESYTYNTSGDFLPSVILRDSTGCEILYNFNQIYIAELNAALYVDTNYVCKPEIVNFIDSSSSSYPITNWQWILDGIPFSNTQNTTNNFTTNGTHPIELIVTNAFCSDTVNDSIIVNGPSATLSNTPIMGCVDLEATFLLSNLISQQQIWDFGEGLPITNNLDSMNYTYNNLGVFFPSVILQDEQCIDTLVFDSIQVESLNAAIYVDTNYVCNPEIVNFIDSSNSSYPITNWQWILDGIPFSNTQNTTNNYTTNGTHPVELIVTNVFCSDTVNDSIIVNGPNAILNNSPTIGCIDLVASFNLSNSNSQEQIWDFGEGLPTTNILDSMTYTYTNVGVFYPSVIIKDANCLDTLAFDSIQIGTLNAAIFVDSNFVCINDEISFIDSSNFFPAITNWDWNFGNGDTSVLQNPLYTFIDTGTFEIELIVNNLFCEDTTSITIFSNGPFASISRTPDFGCIDLNASFNLTVTNSESQIWNFGEGPDVSNNLYSINHLYTNEGTFYPSVIITEANCIDTLLFDSIQVGSINANFNSDKNYVCTPDLVNFYDSTTSIPPVTNWLWDFGDENNSTNQFPIHTYNSDGIYDIKLIVDNGLCQDSLVMNQYIVSDSSTTAAFQIIPPSIVCPPVFIQFNEQSSADSTITNWAWDFNNAVTNNTQTPPNVSFDTSGVFIVSLDITTSSGCTSYFEDSIEINIIPSFSFDLDSIELCRYEEITIDSLGPYNYNWSPNLNLSCANCPNPTITSLNNVVYEVLAITDEGCEYKDSLTFIVNELPDLAVSEGEKVTKGTLVSLNAFSTENVTFNWTPADLVDCIDCPDNDYIANESTEFIVTAIDDFGCEKLDTIFIEVFELCDGKSVFLPNIFTPNDDGKNDEFKITTIQNLKTEINYFRIFDRWGKLVFETTDMDETWNGTNLNGQNSSTGVYVYTLEVICLNGESILLNGNVTLLR